MKRHKIKIAVGAAAIAAILIFAYWWGGGAPGLHGWNPHAGQNVREPAPPEAAQEQKESEHSPEQAAEPEDQPAEAAPDAGVPADEAAEAADIPPAPAPDTEAGKEDGENSAYSGAEAVEADPRGTVPAPAAEVPEPIDPQDAAISDKLQSCTLSVRCDSALGRTARLEPEKAALLPADGVIYAEQTVSFYEGESVFNLLVREMKRAGIPLEFENVPIYGSAYIEGIQNLYESDCGELSGWMYRVNGRFPDYGCSRYRLRAGDRVEWVYTCDSGRDVGGGYAAWNGKQ